VIRNCIFCREKGGGGEEKKRKREKKKKKGGGGKREIIIRIKKRKKRRNRTISGNHNRRRNFRCQKLSSALKLTGKRKRGEKGKEGGKEVVRQTSKDGAESHRSFGFSKGFERVILRSCRYFSNPRGGRREGKGRGEKRAGVAMGPPSICRSQASSHIY